MEENNHLKEDSPYLLVRHEAEIDKACKLAVREALIMHKRANNPVAVWRDGKVVLLRPNQINLEEK